VIAPETADFGAARAEDVTVYGPAAHAPAVILTIHTFRGTMSFTSAVSGCGSPAAAQQVERLLDLCIGELPGQ